MDPDFYEPLAVYHVSRVAARGENDVLNKVDI